MRSAQKELNLLCPTSSTGGCGVGTGGAESLQTVPLVTVVLGTYTGTKPPEELHEQTLTEIDRTNFDRVIGDLAPEVVTTVPNRLENDGTEIPVAIRFSSRDSFKPDAIISQVPPLRELNAIRQRLADLLALVQQKPEFEKELRNYLELVVKSHPELAASQSGRSSQ